MILAAATSIACAQSYVVVMDGEDSNFRVASGNWSLNKKTNSFLGNYRFTCSKGTGNSLAVWDIDSIPDGTYHIEYYIDTGNYAANAEYIIEDDSGVTTVYVNQNNRPKGWHPVGTFTFTGAGRLTQTDNWTGAGTEVVADAIRLTYQGTPPTPVPGNVPAEVSIVIDDLGALNPHNTGTYTYNLFNNSSTNYTYAVLPFLTYTSSVMADADSKGIETILHQPMEYIDGPTSGDPARFFVNMTGPQLLSVLDNNLLNLKPLGSPLTLDGLNNHQGSRFSQHRPGLEIVIQDMKNRGLYFLDSRTISDSVSYDIAREKGLLTAERDLFVDGSSPQNTLDLIESLAQRALYKPNYNYVMICHQRVDTVPGLINAVPMLQNMGVAITPMKHNLHYIMEVGHVPDGANVVQTIGTWTATDMDMISRECFDGDAWTLSNATPGSVTFTPDIPRDGQYRVFAGNRFGQAVVNHKLGSATVNEPVGQGRHDWAYLGSYPFDAGTDGSVVVQTNPARAGNAVADAIKFVYIGEQDLSSVPEWSNY